MEVGVAPVPSQSQSSTFLCTLLKRPPKKVFFALKFRTDSTVREIKGVFMNDAQYTRHVASLCGKACASQSATLRDYLSHL